MKQFPIIAFLVLATSCKKEALQMDASISVRCRQCIVEYTAGDRSGRDSITWFIQGGDTLESSGRWNFVLEAGDAINVIACSFDTIPHGRAIELTVTGDVQPLSIQAVPVDGCLTASTEARN